jgi:hypothetical protein
MICDLIILFVPAYVGSGDTPDSTLEDQARGARFEDSGLRLRLLARSADAGRARRVAVTRRATHVDT